MKTKDIQFVIFVLFVIAVVTGCSAEHMQPKSSSSAAGHPPVNPSAPQLPQIPQTGSLTSTKLTGLRRLTRYELSNSLNAALGVDPGALTDQLPDDIGATVYFDNEYGTQPVSGATVTSYKSFAEAYAAKAVTSSGLVSRLGGCTPASPADLNCFNAFAGKLMRRLFRRTVSTNEISRFANVLVPFSIEDSNFNTGVRYLIEALVQHPEFLYRVEAEAANATEFEIATRMSYFLTGSGPDDQLLSAAETGALASATSRVAQAERLLTLSQSRKHWSRFHGQWLGFGTIALSSPLAADMRQESEKLVDRVTFELNRDWMDILTYDESYVTPALAAHYGYGAVTQPGWVKLPGGRGGIVSQAAFLALGGKFGDTSPTLRGYEIFKRVLCGKLGTIPAGVDTDVPPGSPSQCKPQRYYMRTVSTCATCHNTTDGIGFGLENYDANGQWRASETGNAACSIAGDGTVNGKTFNGAKQLGEVLKADPAVSICASKQLFRFFAGRADISSDALAIAALNIELQRSKTLKSLILELMKSPMITFGKGKVL